MTAFVNKEDLKIFLQKVKEYADSKLKSSSNS